MSLGTYLLAFYIGIFLDTIKDYINRTSGSWKTRFTGIFGYSGTTRDTRSSESPPPPRYQKQDASSSQQARSAFLTNRASAEQPKNGLGTESEKEPVGIQDSSREISSLRRQNQTNEIRAVEEGKGSGLTARPHTTS